MTTNKKLYELLKSANLIELEKALIENLREEAAKESGNKKELTIIKNMMKHNEKNNPIFCGYCEEVGGYSFTDGYRIFKDSKNNYNYSQSKTSFKASDLIKNTCENCTNTIEIDIAALKLYISTHSKKELKEKPFVIKLTNNAV